jgi:acylphosphatase
VRVVRAHVVISGRVQGVFFRTETAQRARSLSLVGWVRNRHEGTVEAVFEGPSERVDSMVQWCEHGPSGAAVEDVDVRWEPPAGEAGFTVR